ncbi:unnamed protein product [Adineta steineri]|uniref:Uncharacterized protein n=1 Tax=Adineta steineri TaxID=433720 RepID=A0A813QU56_9BILA|nr:unnamed protein product [Adineta steineri]
MYFIHLSPSHDGVLGQSSSNAHLGSIGQLGSVGQFGSVGQSGSIGQSVLECLEWDISSKKVIFGRENKTAGNDDNSLNLTNSTLDINRHTGEIAVLDDNNRRIIIFNSSNSSKLITILFDSSNSTISNVPPSTFAYDRNYTMYVLDGVNKEIVRMNNPLEFGKNSTKIFDWSSYSQQIGVPPAGGLCIDNTDDNIFINDGHQIFLYDQSISILSSYVGNAAAGNATEEFNNPTSIVIDNYQRLFVNDVGNNRIQMFEVNSQHGITLQTNISNATGLSLYLPDILVINTNTAVYLYNLTDNITTCAIGCNTTELNNIHNALIDNEGNIIVTESNAVVLYPIIQQCFDITTDSTITTTMSTTTITTSMTSTNQFTNVTIQSTTTTPQSTTTITTATTSDQYTTTTTASSTTASSTTASSTTASSTTENPTTEDPTTASSTTTITIAASSTTMITTTTTTTTENPTTTATTTASPTTENPTTKTTTAASSTTTITTAASSTIMTTTTTTTTTENPTTENPTTKTTTDASSTPAGLKTYDYQILNPLLTNSVPIANTDLNVRIFRLCHTCPYLSSAFLISRRDQSNASVLYLGDTGPDDVEKIIQPDNTTFFPRYLDKMWKDITPLVVADQLKAIFIEVSYPSERPDNLLFGHLTPKWLLKELNILNSYHSIEKVKIIVTHIKPEKGAREKIIEQLKNNNDQHFNFIFPQQGEAIWL